MEIQSKKIPYSITKIQLVTLCYPYPESTIRNRINAIIYDNRKNLPENAGKTILEVIRGHFIEKSELIEYFQTYGLPDGYQF